MKGGAAADRAADKKSAAPPARGKMRSARTSQPSLEAQAAFGFPVAAAASASDSSPLAVDGAAVSPLAGKRAERSAFLSAGHEREARGCSSRAPPAAIRKSEPRLRPKKTHSGLEEKMEATDHAYGVYVHWDRYAGHHVHVLPPEVDAMHVEEMLLVPSCTEAKRKEKAVTFCKGLLACGLAPDAASSSSAADSSIVNQHPPRQQQGRHRRHCIPLYRYQPKLCEKSCRIVDEHREMRLSEVWQKIDLHAEGVVDFFSAPWLEVTAAVFHSHRSISNAHLQSSDSYSKSPKPAGGTHAAVSSTVTPKLPDDSAGGRNGHSSAPSGLRSAADVLHGKQQGDRREVAAGSEFLSPVEERFLEAALLPRLVTAAMLPENRKVARALLTDAAAGGGGSPVAAAAAGTVAAEAAVATHNRLKEAKAIAIAKNLVLLLDAERSKDVGRLCRDSGMSGAASEGGTSISDTAEQTTAEARKKSTGKAEAEETVGVEAGKTRDASGAILPCLLVPKAAFIKAGLQALQRCFGEATAEAAGAVDAFRDLLVRECSRHAQPQRQQRQQQGKQHRESFSSQQQLKHLQPQQQQLRADFGGKETSAGYFAETDSSPYSKPYILHYAQQLARKRRKADQQQDTVFADLAAPSRSKKKDINSAFSRSGKESGYRRYPPRCLQPLQLSAAADWAGAVTAGPTAAADASREMVTSEEAMYGGKNFPASGLRQVVNRFEEQIAHYLRKKLQLEHLKRAMEDMQEREFCSFHPAVNKTPRYLKQLRKQRRSREALAKEGEQQQVRTGGWLLQQLRRCNNGLMPTSSAAADPMEVLALYCKYYSEDPQYEQLVQDIRECCFQPNIAKFVKREQKRQQQLQKQETRRQQELQQEQLQRRDSEEQEEQQKLGDSSRSVSSSRQQGKEVNRHSRDRGAGAAREERKIAATRKAEEARANAAADELFAMLDTPFDAVFQTDIRQWLHSRDGRHYAKCPEAKEETTPPCSGPAFPATTEADTHEIASETENSEEEASPQQQRQEWKKWIREKRQPQYRGPRERNARVSEVLCAVLEDRAAVAAGNPLAADAAVAVKARAAGLAASAEKAAKLPSSNAYKRWVEGLRGGYLSNPMDFSTAGEEGRGEDEKKKRRYCTRDWSRCIRLEQRAVEVRVLPNREIADSLCEAYMPSAEVPRPTVWNPRRSRWRPAEERKPSAYTYTQANYYTDFSEDVFSSRGRSTASGKHRDIRGVPDAAALSAPLPSASRAAQYAQHRQQELQQQGQQQPEVRGLLRMSRSGEGQRTLQESEPTTFILPTPVKAHKIREQFRVYIQLRHGIDSGEIYVPPRVCAVKRTDILRSLEKEIEKEVPQVLLLTQTPEEEISLLAHSTEQQHTPAEKQAPAPPQWKEPQQYTDEEGGKEVARLHEKEENELSWSRASTAAAEGGAENEEKTPTEARKTAPRRKAATDTDTLKSHSQRIWASY